MYNKKNITQKRKLEHKYHDTLNVTVEQKYRSLFC